MNETLQYSIVIEWSPEDQAYVVVLPEWADRYAMPVASGSTYEEAATRDQNCRDGDPFARGYRTRNRIGY